MKLSLQKKITLALTLLFVSIPAAYADYPLPGRQGNTPVLCTGCPGFNPYQQANDGLKTWPYSSPIVAHAGRFLDSTETQNFQTYVRTLRARGRVRIAPQRGNAPPRIYMMLGSAIGAYSIDRFFTTALPGGLVPVTRYISKATRGTPPNPEKLVLWDVVIHPEASGSGWQTPFADGQDRMFDIDYDDRGYVYAAAGKFGWGISKDSGEMSGLMPLTKQVFETSSDPKLITALHVGSKYYAVVTDSSSAGRHVWDVTNPAAPVSEIEKKTDDYAFISWARDDANDRIAIVVKATRVIEIYDYATFVTGGAPLETYNAGSGKDFKDVTVDELGNFWAAEASKSPSQSNIIKLERNGSGYTKRSFDVHGGVFAPPNDVNLAYSTIEYRDKYLTVVGRDADGMQDVRLFKVEGGEPVKIELNSFFRNYYWSGAPRDYSDPDESTIAFGIFPLKWNNKVYLIQCSRGLGDVFELQAGDSITVTQKSGTFGTVNPHAPTPSQSFYGDILRFTATSSNASFEYNITWNFGNPESDDNTPTGRTGDNQDHQFTGLNTAVKINQTRLVKATSSSNSDMSDAINLTLTVPTARIGIKGTSTVLTADNGTIDVVAGDEFTDSSDGTVEGHYSAWTVDATATEQKPNVTMPVGAIGDHTVTLAANYGKYDTSFNTVGSPYVDSVSNLDYTVRPFVAAFGTHTKSGSTVTFKGAARKTSLTALLTAATWTVEWSLKGPGTSGTDIVPPKTEIVTVGTVPNFPVTATIPNKSILKLKISVDPLGLGAEAANYASHEITQELITPDPAISKSGCANTGSPCTLTASSAGSNPTAGWTYQWTLKRNGSNVDTFTGNPYTPTLSEPGNYTAVVKASTSIFEGSADTGTFAVEGPLCGALPPFDTIEIYTSCYAGCQTTDTIEIRADIWGYEFQECEEYQWDFGDGVKVTTTTRDTTHKYSSGGTKTIRLKIKKGTQTTSEKTRQITIGNVVTCDSPSNITVSYSGSKGCGPGTNCKTGETVTFVARKNGSSLQTCDSASWTFGDGGTSSSKTATHGYAAAGTYTAGVVISNSSGTSSPVNVTITVVPDTSCAPPPTASQMYIQYTGASSGCTGVNKQPCAPNEAITFKPRGFPVDNFQSCDRFEWNFGDNTSPSSAKEPQHAFAGNVASYRVALRVYNDSNTTGSTVNVDVPFPVAIKPLPKLSWSSFPSKGSKGTAVTFVVISDINATGWIWDFGDNSSDNSQAALVAKTATVTHTYTRTGTYAVSVRARNAEDSSAAPTDIEVGNITIDDIPEYRYLLPVVAHAEGIGSTWRTDVQIYTPDASVSPASPLSLTATFKGVDSPLLVHTSTFVYEDFLARLKPGANEQGPVLITVRTQHAPQIWTRTYNQTDAGTFGQFIPAIRLDTVGSGSAVGEGRYHLAGLHSTSRYRTNVGIVNPNAQTIPVTLSVYDDLNAAVGSPITKQLAPFQLDQFPVTGPADRPFSIEIEVPAGSWLIAYASLIDGGSGDPVYMQAIRSSELSSADYRTSVIPGVGHIGDWRSDVTIFNPYNHGVSVDLEYFDQSGARVAGATAVPIGAGEFLQYSDILKQGILGNAPDSLGMLRVTSTSVSADLLFPMTFARTYNDNGSGKTYGQGIAGFAASRANVKPGKAALVPAVRSDSKYKTNVGLTNLSDTTANATVKVLDPITGVEVASYGYTLAANQSIVATDINLGGGREKASLKIEVTGGNIWAFASIIDRGTLDPEYVPATPLP